MLQTISMNILRCLKHFSRLPEFRRYRIENSAICSPEKLKAFAAILGNCERVLNIFGVAMFSVFAIVFSMFTVVSYSLSQLSTCSMINHIHVIYHEFIESLPEIRKLIWGVIYNFYLLQA